MMMKESLHAEYRLCSFDSRHDQLPGTVWVSSDGASDRAGRHRAPFWASPDMPRAGPEPRRAETRHAALLKTIRRIVTAIRLWRERTRSRDQLRECSDHLLKDIGLRREQVGYEYPMPYSHCD
jgi:uncharacterized protein YjiS (DUF1127 family)